MKNNYIKTLQIVFIAIGIGQLTLAIVFLLSQKEIYFSFKEESNPMHIIAPIFAVSAVLITQIFFKQSIKHLKNKETATLKLNGYKTLLIIKLAILEGAGIMSCITFSIDGNLYYMVIFGVLLIVYSIEYPTLQKTSDALDLSTEDIAAMK